MKIKKKKNNKMMIEKVILKLNKIIKKNQKISLIPNQKLKLTIITKIVMMKIVKLKKNNREDNSLRNKKRKNNLRKIYLIPCLLEIFHFRPSKAISRNFSKDSENFILLNQLLIKQLEIIKELDSLNLKMELQLKN